MPDAVKGKQLGDAELEIMQVLWDSAAPVTATYILGQIQNSRKWALSSLMTALERLVKKGFVLCDRSTRTNLYSAVISQKAYRAAESKSFLHKIYHNSLTDLVACLYDNKDISPEDISQLRALLDRLEKESNP